MKKFAMFLIVLCLSVIALGCTGGDPETDGGGSGTPAAGGSAAGRGNTGAMETGDLDEGSGRAADGSDEHK